MRLPPVSGFLFLTTVYYWDHRDEMPQCAGLVTFRDYTAEGLRAIPLRSWYFQLWRKLSLQQCLAVWLIAFFALLFMNKRIDRIVLSYGAMLVFTGIAMIEGTALVGELIPRYTLPLWEFLWISGIIFAGVITEKKSAGQLVSQVKSPADLSPKPAA